METDYSIEQLIILVLELVIVIVFFVMAANVAAIKKHVIKDLDTLKMDEHWKLGEYHQHFKRPEQAKENYEAALFYMSKVEDPQWHHFKAKDVIEKNMNELGV